MLDFKTPENGLKQFEVVIHKMLVLISIPTKYHIFLLWGSAIGWCLHPNFVSITVSKKEHPNINVLHIYFIDS